MGKKLSPRDLELYQRTDEVLHYLWDPCSASDAPQARDEYYAYLPVVFSLLKRGATADEIVEHLDRIEAEQMGLSTENTDRTRHVAEVLIAWRDNLPETHA